MIYAPNITFASLKRHGARKGASSIQTPHTKVQVKMFTGYKRYCKKTKIESKMVALIPVINQSTPCAQNLTLSGARRRVIVWCKYIIVHCKWPTVIRGDMCVMGTVDIGQSSRLPYDSYFSIFRSFKIEIFWRTFFFGETCFFLRNSFFLLF